jgi:hypothetical protein
MFRLCDWLEHLRDTLPSDDVVLMITHGDQTDRMLNVLLGRQFLGREQAAQMYPSSGPTGGVLKRSDGTGAPGWMDLSPKSNTSVSCLAMNKGELLGIEFFHRVDHLGAETEPTTFSD